MRHIIRSLLLVSAAVLVQWLLLGRLTLWGAFPDLVLLVVAHIAVRYGRLPGALAGFAAGFGMDLIYGTWGMQMLAKTLVGFVVGLLAASGQELQLNLPTRVFLFAFVMALLQNGILALMMVLDSGSRTMSLITVMWLGSAAYTGFLAAFLTPLRSRNQRRPRWT